MTKKLSINLLQPELLPPKALLTLNRVVASWAVSLVVLAVIAILLNQQAKSLQGKLSQLQAANTQSQQQLTLLENEYKASQTSALLDERLAQLKMMLANKKAFYQQVMNPQQGSITGYSSAMTELAELHHAEISLQHMTINQGHLTFSGLAQKPGSVPLWLAGFEKSHLLAGKNFVDFQLDENDTGITTFVIRTAKGSKE